MVGEIELEVGDPVRPEKGYGIQGQDMRLIVIGYCLYLLYQVYLSKGRKGRG